MYVRTFAVNLDIKWNKKVCICQSTKLDVGYRNILETSVVDTITADSCGLKSKGVTIWSAGPFREPTTKCVLK